MGCTEGLKRAIPADAPYLRRETAFGRHVAAHGPLEGTSWEGAPHSANMSALRRRMPGPDGAFPASPDGYASNLQACAQAVVRRA